jgi:hypothetical protein
MSSISSADDKKQRITFSKDEDETLKILFDTYNNFSNENKKWRKIWDEFCLKFPNIIRKPKDLKDHFNNKLNAKLNRSPLNKDEEEILIAYLKCYGFKFRQIAQMMNRTENSVKNHFNTKLKKKLDPDILHCINESKRKSHLSALPQQNMSIYIDPRFEAFEFEEDDLFLFFDF